MAYAIRWVRLDGGTYQLYGFVVMSRPRINVTCRHVHLRRSMGEPTCLLDLTEGVVEMPHCGEEPGIRGAIRGVVRRQGNGLLVFLFSRRPFSGVEVDTRKQSVRFSRIPLEFNCPDRRRLRLRKALARRQPRPARKSDFGPRQVYICLSTSWVSLGREFEIGECLSSSGDDRRQPIAIFWPHVVSLLQKPIGCRIATRTRRCFLRCKQLDLSLRSTGRDRR